jgi:hypothetical protein
MTPETLVAPEMEEAVDEDKNTEHSLPANGDEGSQSTLSVRTDAELEKLDEAQLKVAIKSEWKKRERLARKDMGSLLYWLRRRLRARGSRNDIHDKDRGFGAWVEDNLDITRRTADRWADGAHQVLQQSSVGANITVGQLLWTDISFGTPIVPPKFALPA